MNQVIELMPYPISQLGGIETHARELTKQLYRTIGNNGTSVVALAYRSGSHTWSLVPGNILLDRELNGDYIPQALLPSDYINFQDSNASLSICNADILHLHGLHRLSYLNLLRKLSPSTTVILSTHGSYWSEWHHVSGVNSYVRNAFDRVLGQVLLERCAAIIVASEAEYEATVTSRMGKSLRGRIHILPLPVTNSVLDPAENLEPSSRRRLLALGRQDNVKGFDFLAETIIAHPDLPPCDIIGPPGNNTRRLQHIVAKDVTQRIRLLPALYDERDRTHSIQLALAVVIPSWFESFSLVAHEAIAQDRPVIISDGAARAVHPAAVQVFHAGDTSSLVAEIRRLPEIGTAEHTRAARANMRATQHSYETYSQALIEIYDESRRR